MSIQVLSIQLAAIKENIAIRDKTRRDSDRVQASLEEERIRIDALGQTLQKETRDVQKLEGLSLTSLFHEVLGSKDEQLNKERQEMLAAQLKYDQCFHAIASLEDELAALTHRLNELEGLDARYESLLGQKEKLLMNQSGSDMHQLLELAEKGGALKASQRELREAIAAGEAVRASLEKVSDSLSSARNWGTWDMLGGGILATSFKHSRIDDARGYVHEAQTRARRFERELADVHLDVDISIRFDAFTKFADYFFDNLITDWIVNSRIEDSQNSTRDALLQVQQTVAKLRDRANEEQKQLAEITSQRQSIVERG